MCRDRQRKRKPSGKNIVVDFSSRSLWGTDAILRGQQGPKPPWIIDGTLGEGIFPGIFLVSAIVYSNNRARRAPWTVIVSKIVSGQALSDNRWPESHRIVVNVVKTRHVRRWWIRLLGDILTCCATSQSHSESSGHLPSYRGQAH